MYENCIHIKIKMNQYICLFLSLGQGWASININVQREVSLYGAMAFQYRKRKQFAPPVSFFSVLEKGRN